MNEEHIINQINNIYNKNLEEDDEITLITKYIYDKLKINPKLNYNNILNDNRILYNKSNNDYIIVQVIHNLNNDLLSNYNYNYNYNQLNLF